MQKVTLKIDNAFFYEEFKSYINNLNGVKSVLIYDLKDEVEIEYDESFISLKIIKMEVLFYLDLYKIPSIVAFDKHDKKSLDKCTLLIPNLCCEYCLKGVIEKLFDIEGINSVVSDFNYINKSNVNIYVSYNRGLISKKEIFALIEELNS